ncbi:MAG: type VI secretion system baseplate subunit TssF [Planctomycetota bacterium]|nr:type VI secretion system baseplate subunit TssF [Planctomycetota bacterium]
MSDDLLDYYNDELRFLREDLARFADRHKGAGRVLQLKKPVPDPHVERLIEAVAGLNARTRLKIDDDFPEIAEALLGMVAPQSLAPVPAMTVIGAALPASLGEAVLGQPIAKGARLETATLEGESTPLTFTTTSDLMLWPMTVERATLEHPVFSDLPQLSVPFPEPVRALVRVRLKSYLPRIPLGQMGVPVPQGEPPRPIPSLRFYLAGSAPEIHQLHELLLAGCMGMTLATAGAKEAVAFDGPKNLYAPGFEEAENLLPNPPRGFFGYRLLTEYFAFPEKFLFLDVSWPPERWCELGPEAELIFYLNRGEPKLTPAVTARTFRLGCVPAINLFTQIADPIPLNQTSAEYLVKPDARNPLSHEVYSIEKVWATTSRGTSGDQILLTRRAQRRMTSADSGMRFGGTRDRRGIIPVERPRSS